MRRFLLLGSWVAATAVAVAVAWGGVQLVARQVVDPIPIALSDASAPPEATPAPTGSPTAPPDAASTPGVDQDGATPADGVDATSAVGQAPSRLPAAAPSPTAPTPPPPGPVATAAPPGGDPTPQPAPAPADPAPAPPELRTYQLEGGTVTVSFSATEVTVVQATPRDGFSRKIEPHGGGVKVEFESDVHRSRLDAWWDGQPQARTREDARD